MMANQKTRKKKVSRAKKRAKKINRSKPKLGPKIVSTPTYKTPISQRIRRSAMYEEWRQAVRSASDGRCKLCGTKNNLQAHHLIFMSRIIKMYGIKTLEDAKKVQILFEPRNGIMVCGNCHDIIHGNGFGWYF